MRRPRTNLQPGNLRLYQLVLIIVVAGAIAVGVGLWEGNAIACAAITCQP